MKSNCVFWALPKFLQRAKPGEETYLIFRRSRIAWGFFHCLLGRLNPLTGEIQVESYKPPAGHKKTKPAPVFEGVVIKGDADTSHGDLS